RAVADPAQPTAALARAHPAGRADPPYHPARSRRSTHPGRDTRGIARAPRRIPHWTAHRTGHRQRQAHELVSPTTLARGRKISGACSRALRAAYLEEQAADAANSTWSIDMKLSTLPTAVAVATLVLAAVAATPARAQMKEQTVTVGGAPMYPSKNI